MLRSFIAAQTEWKALGASAALLEEVVDLAVESPDWSYTLDIELTLTKRPTQPLQEQIAARGWELRLQDVNLTEAAFRPKTFQIQVAKGKFGRQKILELQNKRAEAVQEEERSWYGLRLLFDKSPFPPEDEWTNEPSLRVRINNHQFWEDGYRAYYRSTEESEEAQKPTAEEQKMIYRKKFKRVPLVRKSLIESGKVTEEEAREWLHEIEEEERQKEQCQK
ncbi:hypothetical protein Daus18300_004816 [Diaporthe australafricana]|uniref:Uncharacterized protein n=1 Tax=Diaporthe australafricana TaxID=127596 RepID=A0ABR3X541_9PEZI